MVKKKKKVGILSVSDLHVSLWRGWHCSCQLLEECNHGLYLQRSERQMYRTVELLQAFDMKKLTLTRYWK